MSAPTRQSARGQLQDDALMLAANWENPTPFQVEKFLESAAVVAGFNRRDFMASVGCDNASVGVPEWPEQ